MWQDLIFGVGGLVFFLALIPSIRGKNKPEVSTSIVTIFVLASYCVAQVSLGLYLAAAMSVLTIFGYAILAYQVLQRK